MGGMGAPFLCNSHEERGRREYRLRSRRLVRWREESGGERRFEKMSSGQGLNTRTP